MLYFVFMFILGGNLYGTNNLGTRVYFLGGRNIFLGGIIIAV